VVRRKAEKIVSQFLKVGVYKETEECKKFDNADRRGESRVLLQLSFVLCSGPVQLEERINVIGLFLCQYV